MPSSCSFARLQLAETAPVGVPFTGADMRDERDPRSDMTTADILLVYAPGSPPDNWPAGMAKFIPTGSDLVFQMHYTTHGRQADQTTSGSCSQNISRRKGSDFATDQRPFRHSARLDDYRVEVHGSLPTIRCCSAFSRTCICAANDSIQHPEPDGSSTAFTRALRFLLAIELSPRRASPAEGRHGAPSCRLLRQLENDPHNPDPDAAVCWAIKPTTK